MNLQFKSRESGNLPVSSQTQMRKMYLVLFKRGGRRITKVNPRLEFGLSFLFFLRNVGYAEIWFLCGTCIHMYMCFVVMVVCV